MRRLTHHNQNAAAAVTSNPANDNHVTPAGPDRSAELPEEVAGDSRPPDHRPEDLAVRDHTGRADVLVF